ncbi:MAG: hypothetical protein K2Y37_09785 [Pirellulales bacterium]|nr:hypothetical protein [Pirellulales bacterium]
METSASEVIAYVVFMLVLTTVVWTISVLGDKTWVGVVPYGVTCPKPPFPSACNSGGAFVAAHTGPTRTTDPRL